MVERDLLSFRIVFNKNPEKLFINKQQTTSEDYFVFKLKVLQIENHNFHSMFNSGVQFKKTLLI